MIKSCLGRQTPWLESSPFLLLYITFIAEDNAKLWHVLSVTAGAARETEEALAGGRH